ncbi:MAG: aminopeptidase [Bacteroidetes bacterium]|nr:aminopeptidase [Bacteroidota bacterium]MBL0139084.1 aminopeptidase [Bacteroidota bacterium]
MLKRILKYLALFLIAIIVVAGTWALFNRELVGYGWQQLQGQLNIIRNARSIDKILEDPNAPDSLKARIRFINTVKKFAVDSLGLKESKNYTTLYDQNGRPILWVLTASEPFEIKAYQWTFPVLGSVSYKGFFIKEKGLKEDSLLRAKGYDTDYDDVSAWSTLGWFRDPILSNMLFRKDGQLAELIIHEMTHATLYAKSHVDFNENLASFVGEQGAIRFLTAKEGAGSEKLAQYIHSKEDYDLFSNHMLRGKLFLDSVYAHSQKMELEERKQLKSVSIDSIVSSLDTLPFFNKERFKDIYKNQKPNNAYFINFVRYDAMKKKMKMQMDRKFDGDIRKYLTYLKTKYS